MLTARAFCIARRSAGLLSASGPPALTAMLICRPARVKAFASRSPRLAIASFRFSKVRPISLLAPGSRSTPLDAGLASPSDVHRRDHRGRVPPVPTKLPTLSALFLLAGLTLSGPIACKDKDADANKQAAEVKVLEPASNGSPVSAEFVKFEGEGEDRGMEILLYNTSD